MPHPPQTPHHRRSIRLPGWDYRAPAYYFVTICTHQRQMLFHDPAIGDLVVTTWRRIPTQPHARGWLLDEWVVMPNHLHGLLFRPTPPDAGSTARMAAHDDEAIRPGLPFDMRFAGPWGATADVPPEESAGERHGAPPGSLGVIVGTFKSGATRRINALCWSAGRRVWQRGYYEHIVRNDRELERIRAYIRENPARWAEDRDSLNALLQQMTYHDR